MRVSKRALGNCQTRLFLYCVFSYPNQPRSWDGRYGKCLLVKAGSWEEEGRRVISPSWQLQSSSCGLKSDS